MTANLSVNLNAVAMLRNRRDLPWPDVAHIGQCALEAGAHGLTVHPRPDERHTRDTDLPILRALIDDLFPNAEFNVEGYPADHFMNLVLENQPQQVTLVPDDPAQATSDHGWDFIANEKLLMHSVKVLRDAGCRVSLFCDPDASEDQIKCASATGADRLEFYTEPYAAADLKNEQARNEQLDLLKRTADFSRANDLVFNAGHDLTVANLPPLVEALPDLAETSIGHGLTADALEHGMAGSVKRFLTMLGH